MNGNRLSAEVETNIDNVIKTVIRIIQIRVTNL